MSQSAEYRGFSSAVTITELEYVVKHPAFHLMRLAKSSLQRAASALHHRHAPSTPAERVVRRSK
jgi:hypothetical protein